MGLLKNLALMRKGNDPKPTDKECLLIRWNGSLEIFRIGYPSQESRGTANIGGREAPRTKIIGKRKVGGREYLLQMCDGEFLAMPLKKKAEPVSQAIAQTSKPEPKLKSPRQERLTKYFNHSFDAILDKGTGWKTSKFPLDGRQIWKAWEAGDLLIGLGFGRSTRYGLIDIDANSPYHGEEGLKDIRWALESIGINDTVPIQSSRSEGWHLYFGFSGPVPTFGLSCLLHSTMEAAGLIIAKGKLELFPNRKGWGGKDAITTYNRHRLPLQPGQDSYLLDDDGLPYSADLRVFLDRMDDSAEANDIDLILEGCEEARRNYNPAQLAKARKDQSIPFVPHNSSAKQWKKTREDEIAVGWTANHQSNGLLGKIAEYGRVFLGYDDEHELANYIVTTAIAAPGFIPYCRHRREIKSWALRWARCAIQHRYPYGTRKGGKFKQLGKGGLTNEEKHAECFGRVFDAVADFEASGREWPATIHARRQLLSRMANCSERTLIKPTYLPLWHPNHTEIACDDSEAQNALTVSDLAMHGDAGSHLHMNCGVSRISDAFELGCRSERSDFRAVTVLRAEGSGSVLSSLKLHSLHFSLSSAPLEFPQLSERSDPECKPVNQLSGECTISGAALTEKMPVSPSQSETQPFLVTMSVPEKLQAGDWVVEANRPHRLLKLESIYDDGEWCRCQDSRQRQRGLRGGLYALVELEPAPLAIADSEGTTSGVLVGEPTNPMLDPAKFPRQEVSHA